MQSKGKQFQSNKSKEKQRATTENNENSVKATNSKEYYGTPTKNKDNQEYNEKQGNAQKSITNNEKQ